MLEIQHIPRADNSFADELSALASAQAPMPPGVFEKRLSQMSVRIAAPDEGVPAGAEVSETQQVSSLGGLSPVLGTAGGVPSAGDSPCADGFQDKGISGVGACPRTDGVRSRCASVAEVGLSCDGPEPGQSISVGRTRSSVDGLGGKSGLGAAP